jgi:hypothetical protein
MAKLSELSRGQQTLIGNNALREELDWGEPKYNRIKNQLVDEGAIIVGRGRGGTVALGSAPGARKTASSVFIAYSHVDSATKSELLKHLEPLSHLKLVETWHDGKIKAGEEWDKAIADKLKSADIILLLVSIDFINSRYCYEVELETAMERHEAGTARVIPVILRPCLWGHTLFAKLQALPKDAKAVTKWDSQDEALTNVAEGVLQVAKELLASI